VEGVSASLVRLWRPWYWLPGMASGLAGACWAGCSETLPGAPLWLVGLALGPGVCGFAEVIGDIFDYPGDASSRVKEFLGVPLAGGSGVIVQNPKSGLQIATVLSWLSCFIAVTASFACSLSCTVVVLCGLVLAWIYSAPPVRAKGRGGLGPLLQGLGYGPVAFIAGVITAGGRLEPMAFVVGLLIGGWVASVGITADLLDLDDDQHAGRKTLAVILGRSGTVFFALVGGMVCLSGAALVRFALGDGYNGFAAITSAGFVAYAIVLLITRGKRLLLLTHFIALLLEVCYPLALALR